MTFLLNTVNSLNSSFLDRYLDGVPFEIYPKYYFHTLYHTLYITFRLVNKHKIDLLAFISFSFFFIHFQDGKLACSLILVLNKRFTSYYQVSYTRYLLYSNATLFSLFFIILQRLFGSFGLCFLTMSFCSI